MPTTQPLDDELSDFIGGPIKEIAAFKKPAPSVSGTPPRASVPTRQSSQSGQTDSLSATSQNSKQSSVGHTPGGMTLRGIRTPKGSIHGERAAIKDTTKEEPRKAATVVKRTTDYTPSNVESAWQLFIDRNKAEHLLIHAMGVAKPVHITGDMYRVAQSPIHIGYIRENLNRLLEFIRNQLRNDMFDIELQEVNEDSPMAWDDRRFLNHVVEKTPEVGRFITDLDLHLL